MTERTLVIAEAGVNHNGDLRLAERLVDEAAAAGADAVKFQTFSATRLTSATAGTAAYQKRNIGAVTRQVDLLTRLELDAASHRSLKTRCQARGLVFMSSPFDIESAEFLAHDLGIEQIKVPSGEVTNGPYLLAVARCAPRVILSSGMADLSEIALAMDVLAWGFLGRDDPRSVEELKGLATTEEGHAALAERVTLLHCTTEYPAPPETINLRAMATLAEYFRVRVGLSDHSEGVAIPIAAVGMGARIIEKHMTLDRDLPGPDHRASLEPDQFAAMVSGIRVVEEGLGSGVKVPFPVELENRRFVRKGLAAARTIAVGEAFSADNLTALRPADGMSPMFYWDLLGGNASRDYAAGDRVEERVRPCDR